MKSKVKKPAPKRVPNPPQLLDGDALAEWKRLIPQLDKAGLLARADRNMIALYCKTWARIADCEREIAKTGLIVNSGGRPVNNPYLTLQRGFNEQLARLSEQIGLAPTAYAPGTTHPAQPKRPGRPPAFTPETAKTVCALIAEGLSLRKIAELPGMPSKETVREWLATRPEFAAQYARAREEQADTYADDIVEIADDPALDPNDKRVRVDARKWIACKLKPKAYGDRVTNEHVGKDGGPIEMKDVRDRNLGLIAAVARRIAGEAAPNGTG